MANLSYLVLKQREKMYIKAYAVLSVLVLLVGGFYTYKKWQEYSLIQAVLEKNESYIAELRDESADEKNRYESQKENFNNLNKEIQEKLAMVFPQGDNYTALTRQLDEFEQKISTKNNPFEVSNIEYETPVVAENYSIMPFRMNIQSSSENFRKFLHLMESSGSLKDQVRLMEVTSIRLNFEEDDEDTSEMISFTVQINAYFK